MLRFQVAPEEHHGSVYSEDKPVKLSSQARALVDWAATKFSKPSDAIGFFRTMAQSLKKDCPHRAMVYQEAASWLQ